MNRATSYTIAVDCDGTLWSNRFPEIGEIGEEHANLHQYLRKAHELGAMICMWTCRHDVSERKYLTEAIDYCKENGIPIDYVNDSLNTPEYAHFKQRKIHADEYIDDKAININAFKEPIFINQRLSFIKDGKMKNDSLDNAWRIILKNLGLKEELPATEYQELITNTTSAVSKILKERNKKL